MLLQVGDRLLDTCTATAARYQVETNTAAAGRWNQDEQHPPHDREVAGASTADVPRITFQKYILSVEAQADNGIKSMRKTL